MTVDRHGTGFGDQHQVFKIGPAAHAGGTHGAIHTQHHGRFAHDVFALWRAHVAHMISVVEDGAVGREGDGEIGAHFAVRFLARSLDFGEAQAGFEARKKQNRGFGRNEPMKDRNFPSFSS